MGRPAKAALVVRLVSDPGSGAYGHYLTLRRFRRFYGARARVRHRAMRFLRGAPGGRSVEMGSTGTVVMAVMTVGTARRLFCARGLRPALGAVNRLLYRLAGGPSYGKIFWDVIHGTSSPRPDSPLGRSPAGGAAQPGYDLATGLGSLNGAAFAAAVASARSAGGGASQSGESR